jgi:hypothetical protein
VGVDEQVRRQAADQVAFLINRDWCYNFVYIYVSLPRITYFQNVNINQPGPMLKIFYVNISVENIGENVLAMLT